MVVKHKKTVDRSAKKPLVKLALIVIPTVITVLLTLTLLYFNGVFMSPEDKLEGNWQRTRKGQYSAKVYREDYVFNSDGTGLKSYTDPDGETVSDEFTWCITKKKTLVIDGHVKYTWNPRYTEYFENATKTAKKYWFITKDKLYIGEDTTPKYEEYSKQDK